MTDTIQSPERASQTWKEALAQFIVEANRNTWAANSGEVEPQRPGYKELEHRNGDWLLHDSYTGYFRAPGMTTIYYKNTPAWTMCYGGLGMSEGYEGKVKDTFSFLKRALMQVSADMPLRGPAQYEEGSWSYTFHMEGDIEDCTWTEAIYEGDILVFSQTGFAGIVIGKDADRQPVYPCDR